MAADSENVYSRINPKNIFILNQPKMHTMKFSFAFITALLLVPTFSLYASEDVVIDLSKRTWQESPVSNAQHRVVCLSPGSPVDRKSPR